ncbi:anhydro-N-acetylmuramic acid kinase [Pseudoalteromonas luteoviolacea]|uniref:anhydro-N-acetylmuramic acid kinase n=1 Tax=Pseudoalteromonas luteoviolacea TaxID=43657 RepID=UPI003F7DBB3A
MNPYIEKLYKLSTKNERIIIGLMSGTSLDGLDIAVCKISNFGADTKCEVTHFATISYSDEIKNKIRPVFSTETVELKYLTLLNPWIGTLHGHFINQKLTEWGIKSEEIDLIASHGQTIYHCPNSFHSFSDFDNGTLQIGDADHIAAATNIITLSDFRQKHIAAGFEGAPLAQYGDYNLFANHQKDTLLLNIGGIANFTFIGKGYGVNDVICSDIGPGNTLMDQYVQKHFDIDFDKDGEIASKGVVNKDLLDSMLSLSFIKQAMPKTTGPELFNLELLEKLLSQINTDVVPHDIMATLNEFTASCIVKHIQQLDLTHSADVLVSGGGAHNLALVAKLQDKLGKQFRVIKLDENGVNADSKEAVLFAILANETVMNANAGSKSGKQLTMGKISLPL